MLISLHARMSDSLVVKELYAYLMKHINFIKVKVNASVHPVISKMKH